MNKRFAFALSFLLPFCAAAQPDALASFVRLKADSLVKAEKLPGIFVAVLSGGQRRYFSAGYAVPDEKQAFDSATVFEAGSITKTFTACVVTSVLSEKGLADTASVLPFLPDSVQTNTALAGISFRSLLNHTSGLPRLPANINLQSASPYDNYTEADLFAFLKTANLWNAGQYGYSNLGAGLAGVLAQRISGRDYKALLQRYVFDAFGIRQLNHAKKAQGYFNETKSAFWNMAALAPAGDLDCTASEMLDYLAYTSKPGNAAVAARLAKLEAPTHRINPRLQIGLGWHLLEDAEKPTLYWHNGGTYGFSTFAAYRKNGQAVVVVINRFGANNAADGLGVAVIERLLKNQ